MTDFKWTPKGVGRESKGLTRDLVFPTFTHPVRRDEFEDKEFPFDPPRGSDRDFVVLKEILCVTLRLTFSGVIHRRGSPATMSLVLTQSGLPPPCLQKKTKHFLSPNGRDSQSPPPGSSKRESVDDLNVEDSIHCSRDSGVTGESGSRLSSEDTRVLVHRDRDMGRIPNFLWLRRRGTISRPVRTQESPDTGLGPS